MIATIDLRGSDLDGLDLGSIVPRAPFDVDAATAVVAPLIAEVAERGAEALAEYSARFDQVVPESFRVPVAMIEQAVADLDPALRSAIETSISRRRAVAAVEAGERDAGVEVAPGARVSQRLIPVNRVGLYVPGGLAPLSSSVVMNVVPAQVAGVGRIAVASPPQKDFGGWPHPVVLAVCGLLGVEEVYAVGGAQAIAMFAHGVDGVCPKVDLVTGPGNIYVVAAKRLLRGRIGIDAEAGPTEIAVLADETAEPGFVAADLISQAEHDPLAGAVLITTSLDLAERVRGELAARVPQARHAERIAAALSGGQSAIVLVDDLDAAVAVADAYAAEHLEIQTADPGAVAARITNAGAIFLGPHSPVSLGDYVAGSTHVLPTAGCACHSSGLGVRSFLKAVHVIDYDAPALAAVAGAIVTFAEAEELPAHGAAVAARFEIAQPVTAPDSSSEPAEERR
ncbi:histidinol dehydrogenase [Naumannella halotolerans]|uniref:histidinol dehydrogenase n=1 Tax=Naumannella halotolerans TaxID=993414 RepID=UPI0014150FFD|nr:histidinol dehydrogenase [Naumannella halotolerans]